MLLAKMAGKRDERSPVIKENSTAPKINSIRNVTGGNKYGNLR